MAGEADRKPGKSSALRVKYRKGINEGDVVSWVRATEISVLDEDRPSNTESLVILIRVVSMGFCGQRSDWNEFRRDW